MKLTKETLAVIKNFSSINSNLLLKEGNKLSTITPGKNVMAEATISDEFPIDFGIYDVHEFLGVVSLFEDPDFTFSASNVQIKKGSSSIKYTAASPSALTLPPEKKINFPAADVTFTMPATMLSTIIKTSSVLRAEDISVVSDGEKLKIVITDKKNTSANSYELELDSTHANVFKFNLKVDNLKLLNTDYKVEISKKKISRFTSTDDKLVYYVAVEQDSTYED